MLKLLGLLKGLDLDLRGKVWLLQFLMQSGDEFENVVADLQIAWTDPDDPDKEAAVHRIVTNLFVIRRNYRGDLVASFDAIGPVTSTAQAFALLPRVANRPRLNSALTWIWNNWDKVAKVILPLLPLILDNGDDEPAKLAPAQ